MSNDPYPKTDNPRLTKGEFAEKKIQEILLLKGFLSYQHFTDKVSHDFDAFVVKKEEKTYEMFVHLAEFKYRANIEAYKEYYIEIEQLENLEKAQDKLNLPAIIYYYSAKTKNIYWTNPARTRNNISIGEMPSDQTGEVNEVYFSPKSNLRKFL